MRVLVVDDDLSVRETLSELLRVTGHSVTTAGTFEEAAALLQNVAAWDVMLVDQILPGGNGLDLAAQARAGGIGAVVCSGHPQEIADLAQRGVAYLAKPFSAAALEAALRAAAGGAPPATNS